MNLAQLIYRLATEPNFRTVFRPETAQFEQLTAELSPAERQALASCLNADGQWQRLLMLNDVPDEGEWSFPPLASCRMQQHAG